jgi:hypothetical protein
MNNLKLITRLTTAVIFVSLILFACKKEQPAPSASANPVSPLAECAENSGYFTINLDGEFHELILDSTTQYTNFYNWFEEDESSFMVVGSDQNSKEMYIELALPGKFELGTRTYSADSLWDFMDIDIGNHSLFVSNITFNVTTSNLDPNSGLYLPVKATFTGFAHSYPWYNQAPTDTIQISGTICLNGGIIH